MKKITYYIIAIWAILMPSTNMAQSEPYAVLSDDNTKLTFYYDDQKAANNGISVGSFDGTWDSDSQRYIPNTSWYNQREYITTVEFDASFANCNTITSTAWWFYGCKNLKTITNISNLKTDNVTDMSYMFWDCSSLTSLDVSGFKTDKVRQMTFMFGNCSSLMSLDVSGFKTDNVSDLYGLFLGCSGLTSLDVSGFNTNNVTHIGQMFNRCSGLTTLDLSSFNTANVIYMSYMFSGCSKLETIYVGSEWSTANVTDGNDIFNGCVNLAGGMGTQFNENHIDHAYAHIDEGETNPGYFTRSGSQSLAKRPYAVLSDNNTKLTFYYDDQKAARNGMSVGPFTATWDGSLMISIVNSDWFDQRENIATVEFDASFANCNTITSTAWWFYGCKNLKTITNISNLKTDHVTDMRNMFNSCSSLTSLDVSCFNTENVTYMGYLFTSCSGLTSLNVSGFKTDNVTDMRYMFKGCSSLTSLDVSGFKTDNVTDMSDMFHSCSSLTSLDVSGFKTDNVTDMSDMFHNCSSLTSLNVSNFKTDKVTKISGMFRNCSNLTDLDVSGFRTDNVSVIVWMFYGCSNLASLDVSNFFTDNVADISYMFGNCSSLTSLDLSGFNTNNVTQMVDLFQGCSKLETIYVSNEWSTEKVTESDNMFSGCTNLVGGMGTKYDSNHTDCAYAHIDEGTTNPGYFSSPNTFRLLISATGNGTVTYNTNTISNQSATYVVEKDASVTITITPDAGNRLKSFSVNGNDEMSNISNGKYTISNINEKTTIDVVFEAITAISVDGIDYSVISVDEGTVKVASGNYGLCLEVPNTITAYNKEYSVVGVETGAFNSSELAAIIWNPEAKLTESVDNPNLLLYVKSKDYAPSGVNNVIVDNKAEKIVLTDAAGGNNFYCPQEFTAEKITYEHNYSMKTGVNTCQGWETIALPFDVSVVYNDLGTELVPYSLWKHGDSERPFWLYSLNDNGWNAETSIKAYTPYIISMPNNDNYDATYNLNGNIVFSASNVKVQASDNLTIRKYGNRELVPNYQNKENNTEIFALNVNNLWDKYTENDPLEGSTFIRNLRQIRPFEAYMTIGNNSTTRSISIFGDGDATGIVNLPMINSGNSGDIKVYTLSGVLVKQGKYESITEGLPKGIYIINNKKVVVE